MGWWRVPAMWSVRRVLLAFTIGARSWGCSVRPVRGVTSIEKLVDDAFFTSQKYNVVAVYYHG